MSLIKIRDVIYLKIENKNKFKFRELTGRVKRFCILLVFKWEIFFYVKLKIIEINIIK